MKKQKLIYVSEDDTFELNEYYLNAISIQLQVDILMVKEEIMAATLL